MAGKRISLLVLALLAAAPVWGRAPDTSLRPPARPAPVVAVPTAAAPDAAAPTAAAPAAAATAVTEPADRRFADTPPVIMSGGVGMSLAEAAAEEMALAMIGPPESPATQAGTGGAEPAPAVTVGTPPVVPPAARGTDLIPAAAQQAIRAALAPPPRPAGTLTIAEAAAVETAVESAAGSVTASIEAQAERARAEAARIAAEPPAAAPVPSEAENPLAVASSLHPRSRSASVVARYAALAAERARNRTAAAATPAATPVVARPDRASGPSQRGLCGVPGLQGRELSRIRASTQGCGIAEPVSVTSVQGIPLSMAATIDCTTASAFDSWVRTQALPALGNAGGGVTQIRIAAHYACRPRNNQRGARVSEHGRGRAIDVSGFRLRN
ncbi:MAG: extensin family protein, partial [Pararhodobacter sp.]